ncbi:Uu.00g009160.m01.CDS01 [Anthostomella pinea]|uniref:Uu.00g009160.m01.CDS01 n=1 Tax=Anthostomella pinea TaxID=933095 RepID=A0AAI8YMK7_9PEZI|nr:Uu.00g009160.m01.CDS01 [Anthostomella pinea]
MPESQSTPIDSFLLTAVGRWTEDKSISGHNATKSAPQTPHRTASGEPYMHGTTEGNWVPPKPTYRTGEWKQQPQEQARQIEALHQRYRDKSPQRLAQDHSLAMREVRFWHPALGQGTSRRRGNPYGAEWVLGQARIEEH